MDDLVSGYLRVQQHYSSQPKKKEAENILFDSVTEKLTFSLRDGTRTMTEGT